MADTPTVASSDPPTPPSSAAEQARLRKERREAKIRAGGSARLNKITGIGGGISRGTLKSGLPSERYPSCSARLVQTSSHGQRPTSILTLPNLRACG